MFWAGKRTEHGFIACLTLQCVKLDVIVEGVQVECRVEEALQLHQVRILAAGGGSGSRSTTSIPTHTYMLHT